MSVFQSIKLQHFFGSLLVCKYAHNLNKYLLYFEGQLEMAQTIPTTFFRLYKRLLNANF